ncbi:MAG: hypothetical protein Q8O67_10330 [Deltaproteobacteria bacterium]|nr:hypothetical protein [Deltaproteobacteria bacterium]
MGGQTALRSVAHRFAGACARSLADVTVLGVRYDDDDHKVGDTLVVRVRPGRLDPLASIGGPARAIACHPTEDVVVVVDDRGVLRSLDGTSLLTGVLDLCEDRVGHRLLALQEDGAVVDVVTGQQLVQVAGARSIRGGVVIAAEAVVGFDGSRLHEGAVDVATASGARFAWSKGKNLVVDGRSFVLTQPAHALCFAFGECFVGSQVNGLSVVDEAGLRSLRPSLRAHGLNVVDGGLLVVADLMLATSDDGVDFVSRDLAAYVRLAEKQGDRRSDKHVE